MIYQPEVTQEQMNQALLAGRSAAIKLLCGEEAKMKTAARQSLGDAARGWNWLNPLVWVRYRRLLDEAKRAFRRQVNLPPDVAFVSNLETPGERKRRQKADAKSAAPAKKRKRERFYVDPQTGHMCPESAFALVCGQDKFMAERMRRNGLQSA